MEFGKEYVSIAGTSYNMYSIEREEKRCWNQTLGTYAHMSSGLY